MEKLIAQRASRYFSAGHNCCQSILLAAGEIWSLEIHPDVILAGEYFRQGLASGCTCGALAGGEMALAIYRQRRSLPADDQPAKQLYEQFVALFGSSCCRVLRQRQNILSKVNNQGCKKITAESAALLYRLIADSQP